MQLIIAPAKKMRVDPDTFAPTAYPQYRDEAAELLATLRALTPAERQRVWACSDKLAATCERMLATTDLTKPLTPALLAYVGIQYQSMAPDLFTEPALQYVQAHLRILSGFYGVLRPFDAIVPYRLELGSRLAVGAAPNLYAYWGSRLHDALDFSGPVINLASLEYAKAVRAYLQPDEQLLDVVFGRLENGRVRARATQAKIARGAMVRFLAEHNVQTVAGIRAFDHPQWQFAPDYSNATQLTFLACD